MTSPFHVILETGIKGKGLICTDDANPRFEVLSDAIGKKNCFSLETNRLHPFQRVPNPVVTVVSEAKEKSIGTKFDVIAHHARVHPDQLYG